MRTDSLLRAVQSYLEAQEATGAAKADDTARNQLLKRVCEARIQLETDELAAALIEKNAKPAFRRIMVAVDNSEQAHFALDVAVRFAKALHSELALIHVVHLRPIVPAELAYERTDFRPICLEGGQHLLDDLAERLADFGPVEKVLREGDPAVEIANAATCLGADLLVIGTHGRGRFASAVVGSVAQGVMRKVICPVLCVAHDLAEEHTESKYVEPAQADYFPTPLA